MQHEVSSRVESDRQGSKLLKTLPTWVCWKKWIFAKKVCVGSTKIDRFIQNTKTADSHSATAQGGMGAEFASRSLVFTMPTARPAYPSRYVLSQSQNPWMVHDNV